MRKEILMICLLMGSITSFSQDKVTFSDQELTSYATVMAWAEAEKGRMTDVYNGWIKESENLGAVRFKEINEVEGDSLKLIEIEATDVEMEAYDLIISDYDSMISSFKEVYVGKIKDDIGAGLYNTLRKALRSNPEVSARYEAILVSLKDENEGEDDSEE